MAKAHPALAGAWVQNGKQCLCNGVALEIYYDILPDLPTAEGLDILRIFESYLPKVNPVNITIDLPDLIKREKEEHAARGKSNDRNGYILVKISDYYFDATKLIPILKTLYGDIKYSVGKKQPLIIEAPNGYAALLGIDLDRLTETERKDMKMRLIATYEEIDRKGGMRYNG